MARVFLPSLVAAQVAYTQDILFDIWHKNENYLTMNLCFTPNNLLLGTFFFRAYPSDGISMPSMSNTF